MLYSAVEQSKACLDVCTTELECYMEARGRSGSATIPNKYYLHIVDGPAKRCRQSCMLPVSVFVAGTFACSILLQCSHRFVFSTLFLDIRKIGE